MIGIDTSIDIDIEEKDGSHHSANFRSIRRSVPSSLFQTLVVALVLSRLDYGNATLTGLPANLLNRLQSVLNASCCSVGCWTATIRPHH